MFFSLLLKLGSCLILRCDDCMSVGVVSFVRLEGFVFGLIFCNVVSWQPQHYLFLSFQYKLGQKAFGLKTFERIVNADLD